MSLSDADLERLRVRDSLPMMPEVFQEIEGVVGTHAAIALMRAFGGEKVEFPKKMRLDSKLSGVIPPSTAEKLHEHFGSGKIKLPAGVNFLTLCKARHLRSGASISTIARLLNRDVDTISRYCADVRPGGDDMNGFPATLLF